MNKKRLKKGFTLAEALVAVAILVIFISMVAVGTSGMFGSGEQMMAVSKAAVLGSDVMQVITNELRYGENFTVGGVSMNEEFTAEPSKAAVTELVFSSATYGEGCTLKLSAGGETVEMGTTPSGGSVTLKKGNLILQKSMATGEETSTTRTYIPISTAAYDEVFVSTLTFSCNYRAVKQEKTTVYYFQSILVTVGISGGMQDSPLWTQSVTISPLVNSAV